MISVISVLRSRPVAVSQGHRGQARRIEIHVLDALTVTSARDGRDASSSEFLDRLDEAFLFVQTSTTSDERQRLSCAKKDLDRHATAGQSPRAGRAALSSESCQSRAWAIP